MKSQMERKKGEMVLCKIPVSNWVGGAVEKMRRDDTESVSNWNRYWLETYFDLGGTSKESSRKGCPKAAAYGLWFLGRLKNSGRNTLDLTVEEVNLQLGKNAAYALIAVDLLQNGASRSAKSLWPLVQHRYMELTGTAAARSEQGEIRLVVALFGEGHFSGQRR